MGALLGHLEWDLQEPWGQAVEDPERPVAFDLAAAGRADLVPEVHVGQGVEAAPFLLREAFHLVHRVVC